jgi:hypothetical protein
VDLVAPGGLVCKSNFDEIRGVADCEVEADEAEREELGSELEADVEEDGPGWVGEEERLGGGVSSAGSESDRLG